MDIRLRRFARNPSRHISATMGARRVLLVVLGLTGCGEEASEPDVELEPRDPIAVGSSREGAHLGDLATVGGFVRLGAPGVHGRHPLSPRAMLRAFEGAVYVGDSLEPRVWKVTADGNAVEVVSWEPSEIPSPEEALTAMRDALESDAGSSSSSQIGLALLESGGAQPVSAFWDFQVGPRGHVWILPFDPTKHSLSLGDLGGGNTLTGGSHAADEWIVLHPDGRTVGTVAVPEGFRISQIREDEIVGVRRDAETEVEIVEVYPLERH